MTLRRTALLLLAASAIGSAPAHSQPRIGPGNIRIDPDILKGTHSRPLAVLRNKGCTFYENANGGGASWKKQVEWLAASYPSQDSYSQYVTTVGDWWDNRISSLRCDDSSQVHCSVAVYRNTNRGGGDAIFWGSQGLINLADYGWDDTISSFQVFCNRMK
ncbi:hypothetical protein E3C22_01485 [Jiella endophytica]|uniref:Uncharacterized protein n=1 Tax=Jiella endophytica TaxID=2558362 RepID=A0A4Y8RS77_9HYPH|nr:hypothetical protein [Jiella endophytica]TFF27179.1 hypothetical protein E3C22_01485 [Jiella endophytica]